MPEDIIPPHWWKSLLLGNLAYKAEWGHEENKDSFPKDLAQHFQNQRDRFWLNYLYFQWKEAHIFAKMPLKSEWLFYYI